MSTSSAAPTVGNAALRVYSSKALRKDAVLRVLCNPLACGQSQVSRGQEEPMIWLALGKVPVPLELAWVPQPNGAAGDGNPQPPPAQPSNPHPSAIRAESWRRAEQATQDVIQCIQPTVVSEQRRGAVVDYVQKLIRKYLGTEIFPFGSVPLKTYLPDGDIDLTAVGMPEDALANEVRSVLEDKEQSKDAEFEVKDVQYIHAEVKLVKCIVQNIVVDISFNQIGGLCTLCFLEKVDDQIGKDHLFKRSIILIKAWCYYESRILGAHHGLISTYALETLVLCIFHFFHKSLDGPLAVMRTAALLQVLYRFLDYYSKFDWDNYCISLHGPIPISSLPELIAEPPETQGDDLLLSEEFLKNHVNEFSVPPRGLENNSRMFFQKHLNIVDPLKENNNLGRSVSKGNFYRIRSAFTYGARKLGRILLLPSENIANEVKMFFTNTMERHGSGIRPDVLDVFPSHSDRTMIDHDGRCSMSSDLKVEKGNGDELISGLATIDSYAALSEKINNIKISSSGQELETRTQLSRHPINQHPDTDWLLKCTKIESNSPLEGNIVSGKRLAGDARDLATSRASDSRTITGSRKVLPSNSEPGSSPSGKACHVPHLFFHSENGVPCEVVDYMNSTNLGSMNKVFTTRLPAPHEEFRQYDFYETESSRSGRSNLVSASAGSVDGPVKSSWNKYSSEDLNLADPLMERNQRNGNNRSSKSNDLSDLTGDYQLHARNLSYVKEWQHFLLVMPVIPPQQLSPSQYCNKNSWNAFPRRSMHTHMGTNGVIPGPPFSPPGCYLINSPVISTGYGMEDLPKPRGTGTYFPNMSFRPYRERQSTKGRNAAHANHQPRCRNNGKVETSTGMSLEVGSQEPSSQAQVPFFSGNGRWKPATLDVSQSSRPVLKGGSRSNGFGYPSEGKLAFGSFGPVPVEASLPEQGSRVESFSTQGQGSGPAFPVLTEKKPGMSVRYER
ncbi:hypothetical protein COCNU_04G004440 [Cocos nucifera]|uniref:Polymerase nucleotidyl transferase domain-containing protein n=1 Tax=Cocos nucifera TaxID=13894 RepID=A0A8K0I523_COCNU|nr:hypothetical protein COCNU_04G004440 [Cocos nucifera]